MGSGHLVLHPVVLGTHRNGPRIHTVTEMLYPPLWRRHCLVVMILIDLSRLAVAARLCDRVLDIFRADPRRVVTDMDDIVFPVQSDIGNMWLLSQGTLDGARAAQAVHATELEGAH